MPLFNFNGLIADALILGNIIYHKEMTYAHDTTIDTMALTKGMQVFTQSQGLKNVRSAPCSQGEDNTNMSVEMPVLKKGEAGHTELPNNIGYIEAFDIGPDGIVRPADSGSVAPVSNVSTSPVNTGQSSIIQPADDAKEAVEKFEENWLDKGDFVGTFITGKSKEELDQLTTHIITKKTELDRVIKITDRKTGLMNELNTAKKAFDDAKKEINKLDKEVATYENEINNLKRDTKMDASIKDNKLEKLEQKINVVKNTYNNFNIKKLQEQLDKAEYANRNQDKAEATQTKLEELETEIHEMLKAITEQKDNESKQRVFGAITDLKDHREQLRKFLIVNNSTIESLPFSNKEILELIDIINIALVGEAVLYEVKQKYTQNIDNFKAGKYFVGNLAFTYDELIELNPQNELLKLINALQSKITLDNQPLTNLSPK